jgi:NDP-sugar pyrophosphorylase family protein
MQIAILSGGLGTRLRPFTEEIPKAMVLIENKPFLQYQIELLKKNNITDILLCLGYLSEKIIEYFGNGEKFGVNITYSIEKAKLLGTAGALKNAEKYLKEEFMVMYGDSYLELDNQEVVSCYKTIREPVLMVVYKNENRFDRSNVRLKDNLVVKYEKNSKENLSYIDYGISVLNKKIISGLPKEETIHLEDVFRKLAEERKIHAYEASKSFYEVGSPEGLERFRKYIIEERKL